MMQMMQRQAADEDGTGVPREDDSDKFMMMRRRRRKRRRREHIRRCSPFDLDRNCSELFRDSRGTDRWRRRRRRQQQEEKRWLLCNVMSAAVAGGQLFAGRRGR
jgi:hypothetical protein